MKNKNPNLLKKMSEPEPYNFADLIENTVAVMDAECKKAADEAEARRKAVQDQLQLELAPIVNLLKQAHEKYPILSVRTTVHVRSVTPDNLVDVDVWPYLRTNGGWFFQCRKTMSTGKYCLNHVEYPSSVAGCILEATDITDLIPEMVKRIAQRVRELR